MTAPKTILFLSIVVMSVGAFNAKSADSTRKETGDTLSIRSDFGNYFKNCRVEGSIVVYDNSQKKWIVSDTVGIKMETLPASSFKVINLLIALETGVIKDENEMVKWVGKTDTVKYGYRPEIYRDMTVKEAFEVSAGWVFIELARKIGKEKYRQYLKQCQYGNLNIDHAEDDFWNFGSFGISPKNQVEFLRKLYNGELPFSARNAAILKKVMITEQTDAYTLSTKTGWTRANNINTGWWIGVIETKTGVYFFATRLLQDRKKNTSNFGACRKEITTSVFRDLHILR